MKKIFVFLFLFLTACGGASDDGSDESINITGPGEIIAPEIISAEITNFTLAFLYTSATDTGIQFIATFYNTGNVNLEGISYEFTGLSCKSSEDKILVQTIMAFGSNITIFVNDTYSTPSPGASGTSYIYNNCELASNDYDVTITLKKADGTKLDSQTKSFAIP